MLYDSNGFKLYIYIYIQNLSMCHTFIYSIAPTPKSVEYQFFRAVSEVFGTAETVFTGHVQPMARTYPASQTCTGLGFSAYIKGLSVPLRTLGLFFSSTPSLAVAKGSLGDFGSSPLNPIGFLEI
jgi:hypothetical protein